MIIPRLSAERGHADHGWLKALHSFSFADYYDPQEMGWGALRVINEDRIVPGAGFGKHGHRDMEIVTYILDGTLEHRDSLGNGGVIKRGEVQRMSAGKGILHSEFNPSNDAGTHLLQIWIEPAQLGRPASYEQQPLPEAELRGRWRLVASPDGAAGSTTIGLELRTRRRPPGLRPCHPRSTRREWPKPGDRRCRQGRGRNPPRFPGR
jgi:redox-sensitive bicupin YhaK (pirin superfamily)